MAADIYSEEAFQKGFTLTINTVDTVDSTVSTSVGSEDAAVCQTVCDLKREISLSSHKSDE